MHGMAIPVPGPTIIMGRLLSSGTLKTLLGVKKQRTSVSSSTRSARNVEQTLYAGGYGFQRTLATVQVHRIGMHFTAGEIE
jgi:hypothetical protein